MTIAESVIPAKGLVAKDEITSSLAPKGQAPRNDRKRYSVSLRAWPQGADSENRVAISTVTIRLFQQARKRESTEAVTFPDSCFCSTVRRPAEDDSVNRLV
jgi:hypothetical protein